MEIPVFSTLPDEKIYEICETLDLTTLSQFARTSKHVQYICGNILRQKQIDFLLSKISGVWRKCFNLESIGGAIEITDMGEFIAIKQAANYDTIPIVDDMKLKIAESILKVDSLNGIIAKTDPDGLEKLQQLQSELGRRKYKKIEKEDVWAAQFGDYVRNFYTYPPDYKTGPIGFLSRLPITQVNYLIQRLKIAVTGNESPDELRRLILAELIRRDESGYEEDYLEDRYKMHY